MHKGLLIIGPHPINHGIGGVTIHVQRLLDYLDNRNFKYKYLDYKQAGIIEQLKAICNAQVVHIHISNPMYQFVLTLWGRIMGTKVIVTLHGNYGRFGRFKNWLVRDVIRMSTIPIVINAMSYESCIKINKSTVLCSAFIPPQKEEKLQDSIVDLLERLRDNGKKIVSTNAYDISFDKEGNDVYGIDFLVQQFKESFDCALVISDPSGNYHKRFIDLESDSIYFFDFPHPYFEVLKRIDIFVRNTSTDGDALSVKEALYLGVPALCTNVVDRPAGVRLFKYCDKRSFEDALMQSEKIHVQIENCADKLIEIYKNVIS